MGTYEVLMLMLTFGLLRPGGSPFRDSHHNHGRKDVINLCRA